MFRTSCSSLCMISNLYLKCVKCESYYRYEIRTIFKIPLIGLYTSKYASYHAKFYSISRPSAINDSVIEKIPESEIPDESEKKEKNAVKKKYNKNLSVKLKIRPNKNINSIIAYVKSLNALDEKEVVISALQEKDHGIYLVDKETAGRLANSISTDLRTGSSLILEANPGLGLLSRQLIQTGVPLIRLCEPNIHFFKYLKNNLCSNAVDIHNSDIIKFWKMIYIDECDGGKRVDNTLSTVQERDWVDDPVLKMIATIPDQYFIVNIINDIVRRSGFAKFGRPEFYLVMDPLSYHIMTHQGKEDYKNYQRHSVMFQIIFDYELLLKVPKIGFIPWLNERKRYTSPEKQILEKDGDMLYFVKLTPRKDLFRNNFDKYLQIFDHFCKQLFQSCRKRIIPQFEQWIPGCGPHMIALGYNIYTEVGELTPQEILELFLKLLSLDEVSENSSFLASMDLYFLKKKDPDEIHDDDQ